MKPSIVVIIFLLLGLIAHAQIEKNYWLVGGSGNIRGEANSDKTQKYFETDFNPIVGYFFIDKLSGGIKTLYSKGNQKIGDFTTKITRYGGGPFIRYYVLPPEKRFNILIEGAYAFGGLISKNNSNTVKGNWSQYSLLSGPVFFFNEHIGLGALAGYRRAKFDADNYSGFFMELGLHVHLINR